MNLFRSLATTASAQVLIQGMGFVSGLLVVRLLVPDQYALYTMANAMLGSLTVLADSGISKGALAQGGLVWRDPQKLGKVMVTSVMLRRQFALIGMILALPVLFLLLIHHGAAWSSAALIVLAIAISFSVALTTAIYEVVGQLHQKVTSIAAIKLQASGFRIFALAVSVTALPYSYIALFAGVIPQMWANRLLKNLSKGFTDWTQPADRGVSRETMRLVKRILPGSVFYCLSGQLSVFLISIFGATVAVAQVGALGRLTQVLTLVGAVAATVIVPRFARLTTPHQLLPAFAISLAGAAVLCAVLVGLVALFRNEALWLLGASYEGLHYEMLLGLAGSAVSLVGGIAYALGAARGWVVSPWVSIGATLGMQSALFCFMDLSTVTGVLLFGLIVATVPLAIHTGYNFMRCLQASKIQA